MPKRPLLIGLGLLVACDGAPREPPAIPLGIATDTLQLPYSYLGDAIWLGDQRWALVASNEHDAVLLDLAADSAFPIGGKRHPQYAEPFTIFRSGDSLFLGDWGKRAVTVWDLRGGFGQSRDISQFVRGAFPEARDGRGRFYAKLAPAPGRDGSGNRDSAAIIASTSASQADTVGQLAPLDIAEVFGDAGRRFEPRALAGSDKWGVLPDGTLWIARINQNRVDRMGADGKWKRGDQLPDRVLQVLPEDRDRFLQQFPPDLRSTADKVPFAIIKPPFESAFAGPDGDIWLVKNFSLHDSTRQAQRVGTDGKLKATYEWNGYGRMMGANGDVILVTEPADSVSRILVFKVPPPPTPNP